MQRVAVIGAGPAGCYFAWDVAGRRPDLTVDLFERNAVRPGAGLAIEDKVVSEFPVAFEGLHPSMRRWNRILVSADRHRIWSGGHDIVGVSRRALADHLLRLAADRPNVNVRCLELTGPPDGYDLVVASDGPNSRIRSCGDFGTRATEGQTVYAWLSSPVELPAMFALIPLSGGVLTVHAYPHAPDESTLVAEGDAQVLAENGLLGTPRSKAERRLAGLLHDDLGDAAVRAHTFPWRPFTTITNQRWRSGNLVLLGDAARTVHFSVGCGTALALADARHLADAVASDRLGTYEQTRRPVVERAQSDAAASMHWFEQLSHRSDLGTHQLVFALRTRRDVNSFASLRKRDPDFVASVMREMAGRFAAELEPVDVPLRVGSTDLPRRLVDVAECGGGLRIANRDLLGAVVDEEVAELDHVKHAADFIAVREQPAEGRVLRTELAAKVRGRSKLPVMLLCGSEASLDEVNTLIAAGRIDFAAHIPATTPEGSTP